MQTYNIVYCQKLYPILCNTASQVLLQIYFFYWKYVEDEKSFLNYYLNKVDLDNRNSNKIIFIIFVGTCSRCSFISRSFLSLRPLNKRISRVYLVKCPILRPVYALIPSRPPAHMFQGSSLNWNIKTFLMD